MINQLLRAWFPPLRSSAVLALVGLSLLVIAFLTLAAPSSSVRTQAERQTMAASSGSAPCQTSTPRTLNYSIKICFIAPVDGASLIGPQTISISTTTTGRNPGISWAVFYLDGKDLLTAYSAPYTFVLPTNRWSDGPHQLEVKTLMRDGITTRRSSVHVVFHNGVSTPPVNTATFVPARALTPSPGQPLVVAAVGDGASGEAAEKDVTNLIASWTPHLFLYLGDVYENGTSTEFYNWYGGPGQRYGRFRAITNPTVGNHEYTNGQAPGYVDYWNNVPTYYSFTAGDWHFISLNANTSIVSAAPSSPQYSWLAQDLSANHRACTIVYYHQPLYNVGTEGATRMAPIWALLAQNGVTIVLNAHDHDYQRWVPLNGAGQPDRMGITEFVVGTGGHSSQAFVRADTRLAVGIDNTKNKYGALRLLLGTNSATFQYVSVAGTVLDSGVIPCHHSPSVSPTPRSSSSATIEKGPVLGQ